MNMIKDVNASTKFSIGIPAYKSKYLKECIDSCLAQTYFNFELIIVNDASPEDIDQITLSYTDTRISYYKNEKNYGAEHVVNNWNKCLQYATGDFFVLLGDDDRMEVNYLEVINELILKYSNLDIYHCRTKIIDEFSQTIMYTSSWPEFESVYENIYHRMFHQRNQFISDFIYRTDSLKSQGGFYYLPLAWASDDVTAYIMCGEKGIAHTNVPIFNYRQSNLTITQSGDLGLKIKALNLEQKWFESFLKKAPTNSFDTYFYHYICNNLVQNFKTKKVDILNCAFKANTGLINGIKDLYRFRKSVDLDMVDILLLFSKNLSKIAYRRFLKSKLSLDKK